TLAPALRRLDEAVGQEDEAVPRLEVDLDLLEVRLLEHAQDHAADAHGAWSPGGAHQDWLRVPARGEGDPSHVPRREHAKDEGDEHGRRHVAAQGGVELGQHLRGLAEPTRDLAQQRADHDHEEGGGDALAGDIAHGHPDALAHREDVEEVAPDHGRGTEHGAHLEPGERGGHRRLQALLDVARGLITSRMTRSGGCRRIWSMASTPSPAVSTSNPARRSVTERMVLMSASSSTTRMREEVIGRRSDPDAGWRGSPPGDPRRRTAWRGARSAPEPGCRPRPARWRRG